MKHVTMAITTPPCTSWLPLAADSVAREPTKQLYRVLALLLEAVSFRKNALNVVNI